MSRISSSYIVLLFPLFFPNAICNSIQTGNFTEGKTRGDREYHFKCIGGFLSFFFPLYFLFVVPLFTWLMVLSHRLFSAMEIFYPLFFVQQWRYFNHLVLLTNEDDLPLFCWPWRQVHFVLLTNEDNFTLFCWPGQFSLFSIVTFPNDPCTPASSSTLIGGGMIMIMINIKGWVWF